MGNIKNLNSKKWQTTEKFQNLTNCGQYKSLKLERTFSQRF